MFWGVFMTEVSGPATTEPTPIITSATAPKNISEVYSVVFISP